jgi:acyl carrier protein
LTQAYARQDLDRIKQILAQLLNQEAIGDDENFYQAGLTSIMVLPLLSEVEEAFDVKIPDKDFLDAQTPKDLAKLVKRIRI